MEPDLVATAEEFASAYDRWAPITLTIANTGRPATAWDAQAMEQMREAVECSAAQREEVARESGRAEPGLLDGPAWAAGSPSRDRASRSDQPHFVFSVKNTFLDVEQDRQDP